MSDHPSRDQLWAWAHDEEDDVSASAVTAHMASCDVCRAAASEMQDLVGGIRAARRHAPAAPLPQSIGGYRVIRKIGQGGMGVVYEAEQRHPQRAVALKVILGGVHVDDLRLRMFEREIQTLARLSHPNLAAIYEAGRTADGQQFYAMELVRGVSLTEHVTRAAGGPLSLVARLRLFRRVCDAISYAHQRGVIHRDLKPGNILVMGEGPDGGTPKVLDFGLARLMDDEAGVRTMSGRLVGTPAYMSPEQARGKPDEIDIRTDVYALGVILYELMTGARPYDVSGASLVDAARIVCEQTPLPPRRINTRLPADAATIALKALEKDPARRYQSAAALSDDIERFLTNQPIQARPPTTMYQLRKLVQRHRVPAALLGLLAVSMAVTGAVAMVQARRIAAEATKKSRVIAVFESLYESADPWKAGRRDVTVLESLRAKAADMETELADDPLVAATVRNTIGNTYKSFSEFAEAEKHLEFAARTRRAQLGDDDIETAESLNDLGELRYFQDRLDDAERLWREALAVRRRQRPPDHEDVAETLNNLGILLRRQGHADAAEAALREALAIRRRVLASATADSQATAKARKAAGNNVAQTLNNLAGLLRSRGDAASLDEAERIYAEALRQREEALGRHHPEVAKMLNNIGRLQADRGRLADADASYQAALDILRGESGLGGEHQFIARLLSSQAELALGRGDRAKAERLGEEALDMRRRLLGDEHAETQDSLRLLERIRGATTRHGA